MCNIHAPAGDEVGMTNFLLDYIEKAKANWKVQPEIIAGEDFQDCIILKFGTPRTAIFAHIDSIGYTVKYGRQLIKVGGPVSRDGDKLKGTDIQGPFEATLKVIEAGQGKAHGKLEYVSERAIERGTNLTYVCDWREDNSYIQSCYMDNRLGVWSALQVAETLEDGLICFSCWEEHGGGSVEYLARYMYEEHRVKQALISDITWVTTGIFHEGGCAISIRDSGLPRRSYVNRIIDIAQKSGVEYQLEVEGAGGSDGNVLQRTPYPIDWCFVGAPEDNVHTPDEKVAKRDIYAMVELYQVLMREL